MTEPLKEETRASLKDSSKALLRFHKVLLDSERETYEKVNGQVASPHELFRLVLDDPHFAWLRMLSGQIVLIDEFLAAKTPITEFEGRELIAQTISLLNFEDSSEHFNEKLQNAISRSRDAEAGYNEILQRLKS
jgi:hypothetical protein